MLDFHVHLACIVQSIGARISEGGALRIDIMLGLKMSNTPDILSSLWRLRFGRTGVEEACSSSREP